jgi:sugar/nucleoside kinase (ribokinase family)
MTAEQKNKVMVAGHLCLDITPRFSASQGFDIASAFAPGKLTNVDDAVLSTGGPVSNTGLALSSLGVDVVLNGKIGKDAFGEIIKRKVGEARAKAFKVVADQNSSYTIVISPPGIDRFYLHNPGTNDTFGSDDIDYDLAKDCLLFHFGYPPLMRKMYEDDGVELLRMFRKIKELEITTSMDMVAVDPSSPAGKANWPKILEQVLPYVDIFMPSIDEITFMLNRGLYEKKLEQAKRQDPVLVYEPEEIAEIAERLISMGVAIAAIKCGVRGVYLRSAGQDRLDNLGSARPADTRIWSDCEIWAPSFAVDNLGSTLGAGDATIAGFLCGFIRGFTPEKTIQIANAVGWQNVQAIDAVSGIKDWQSTLEFLEDRSRKRNPTGLESPNWEYSDQNQVYYGPRNRRS